MSARLPISRITLPALVLSLAVWAAVTPAVADQDNAAEGRNFTAQERSHWAYQPTRRTAIPKLRGTPVATKARAVGAAAANPVDAFVRRALADNDLEPSPAADRPILIRRVTIDLLGLPPTPDEVANFVADPRVNAYERLVDRLLASPRYGERWARHWLDLARYAESDGFKSDAYRPNAWRYRDYVIRSFNDDKTYDRFVTEQLAGDEVWPLDGDALIATGFLRHWPYEDNGRDLDRLWDSILDDVTRVTGEVFLGLTVGCARCHDHKFDAIRQRDYYRLRAFFAAMVPHDNLAVGRPEELSQRNEQLARWRHATRALRQEQRQSQSPLLRSMQREKADKFPSFVRAIVEKPEPDRTLYERQLVHLAGKQLRVDPEELAKSMKPEVRERWDALNERMKKHDGLRPRDLPLARGVRDIGPVAPSTVIPGKAIPMTRISAEGIPGEERPVPVEPGFPGVLGAVPVLIEGNEETTGRRTALARWLTSPRNPLATHVIVNQLWKHHFTRGLVATCGDFGVKGEKPTHPELLDWLARELIRSGFSLKRIHLLIVTSATYRQKSVRATTPGTDSPGLQLDPENRLLWRMNGRRIEAEVLRDSILATSGELSFKMVGPSVFPELPKGLTARYGWKATADIRERDRRAIYLAVKRNMHLPLFKTFDLPDNHSSCPSRDETTTPIQALLLLNDRWVLDRARSFAGRLLNEAGTDPDALARRLYSVALGRAPSPREVTIAKGFLRQQSAVVARRLANKEAVLVPATRRDVDPSFGAALVDYCHALWNSNEFLYVD